MKLQFLKIKNITRYTDPVEVDFERMGPGLIALAGVNGAGKTTVLEAPYAALYLEMPSRPGSVYDVAHGRDACIDLAFSNGAPYRALVAVDTVGQKIEAYLFDGAGNPIAKGKVREFQQEIVKRFGSSRLFLSACLSAQTRRGAFLDLSKVERKELLAEMLDTQGHQALAEQAHEREKTALAEYQALLGTREALAAEHDKAADQHLAYQNRNLSGVLHALEAENETLEIERQAQRSVVADAQTALVRAQESVKGRLEAVRAVGEAKDAVDRELRRKADADRAHGEAVRQLEDEAGEADTEARNLPRYLEAEAAVQKHQARVEELRVEEGELARALDASQAAHVFAVAGEHKHRLLTMQAGELRKKLTLLDGVPCHGVGEFAGCGFLKDATAAQATLPAVEQELAGIQPADMPTLEAAVKLAKLALEDCRSLIRTLEIQIKGDMLDVARIPSAKAAEARHRLLMDRLAEEIRQYNAKASELAGEVEAARERLRQAQERMDGLAAVDLSILQTAVEKAQEAEIALDRRLATTRSAIGQCQSDQTTMQAIAQRVDELAGKIAQVRERIDTQAADATEWGLLARAFGRDGIQALEIDAAGPELSTLTNDLLSSCFGERFEVRFVTQLPKADGKGMKEVFDLQVIDHERGREGAVDSLSGGEKTIVSEAISLALAIYAGKHSDHRYETLFRDETAGSLDPDNAHRYTKMLRKALEVGGFTQCIFIAQQPDVWQQADTVLWCQDGRVEVRK